VDAILHKKIGNKFAKRIIWMIYAFNENINKELKKMKKCRTRRRNSMKRQKSRKNWKFGSEKQTKNSLERLNNTLKVQDRIQRPKDKVVLWEHLDSNKEKNKNIKNRKYIISEAPLKDHTYLL
jgi:hypothetical protein